MKPNMYNNYDGYMYTVHNLSLGEFTYKEISYKLDDINESTKLLNILKSEGILKSKVVFNTYYEEEVYKIKEALLYKIFEEENVSTRYLQRKATCLNIKILLSSNSNKNLIEGSNNGGWKNG